MLTQQDIAEIEKLLKDTLDEKTKLLPTKEEFFKKMDELMGEVKAMRVILTKNASKFWNNSRQLRRQSD